jgi:uncharacterized protein (DUF3820 family)
MDSQGVVQLHRIEDRTMFQKAKYAGKLFLKFGEADDFWLHRCQLPHGTSVMLADLVKEIKGVGEEQQPQGNVLLCFSDVVGSI